jgi:hypothetical protein
VPFLKLFEVQLGWQVNYDGEIDEQRAAFWIALFLPREEPQ